MELRLQSSQTLAKIAEVATAVFDHVHVCRKKEYYEM
jgi:hypothetical protein